VISLLCTVRGCALPLERVERSLRCGNNHSFDFARSGYVNLLQPQDRRSLRPGDRKEALLARRSLLEQGYAAPLFDYLLSFAAGLGPAASVLDVGCGEGSHLGRLASRLDIECSGVDISADAIELAARRYPNVTWLVANADRWLPYPDASFDLITSITARRNPSEFARVLRQEGRLFIAVPAPDDLAELRLAAQGKSVERSRVETVVEELREHFELASNEVIREQREVADKALVELLHATYRGLRHSDRQRVESLDRMKVTFAWEVMIFRRRNEKRGT
jgi:23S rRNA (guanine745-N1)-methyltransferase